MMKIMTTKDYDYNNRLYMVNFFFLLKLDTQW